MKFLINLEMDGYESEKEELEACRCFIEEQLDFSGSSVHVLADYDSMRCENCQHWETFNNAEKPDYCENLGIESNPDFYCKDFEARK
jgi:hypothetical protein